jgi:conjugative transfer region protein TrbK
MNLEAFGRAAAFTMLAGTLLATAITMSREGASTQTAKTDTPVAPSNLLDAELVRCSRVAPDAAPDPTCKSAWAESRRRFFGSGRRREDGPIDLVPAARDLIPAPGPVRGEPPTETPRPSSTPDTDPTSGQQAN